MTPSLRMEGGAELAKTLRQMTATASKQVRQDALMEAAIPFEIMANRLAPHEPGAPDLRGSVTSMVVPVSSKSLGHLKGDATVTTVAVGPAKWAFYGFFQEWGTTRHGAQPFMRPSFDANIAKALKIITLSLWTGIQSYLHRAGRSEHAA